MYGLVGAALAAGAVFLWLRRKIRRAQQWSRLFAEASQAQERGELGAAQERLDEAEALGSQCTGLMWRIRARMTHQLRTQVAYRAGDLERASALAFEELEEARAVT